MIAEASQKGWLGRCLAKRARFPGAQPEAYDPEVIERTVEWLRFLFGEHRWFRLDARGFEWVPPSPALFVSNHSGGMTALDTWGLLVSWYRHFTSKRPLHPCAHELLLSMRAAECFFARRGVLHAHPDVALSTLRDHRRDLLVMPGGDVDTWRPFRDRYRVQFAGRTGYARLALKAGVPIVPVAHAGAHHTLVVLTDGQSIAKRLRLSKLARARVWPIHLALPWGIALGPLPHLPLPVTLRYRFGMPIEPRQAPGAELCESEVKALDNQVRRSVQGLLDQLAAGG